jgi:hypothetical protein
MATATKKTPAPPKSTTTPTAKKTSTKKAVSEATTVVKTATDTTKKTVTKTPAVKKSAVAATDTKPAKVPAVKKVTAKNTKTSVFPEQRYHMISTAAYYLAERRGFAGGYEMQDWISAEAEIDRQLKA